MKFKQFLFAAFIAAFAGMAMVGCNENDPNEPDPGDGPDPVTNLEAVSMSNTMVGLQWTGSTGADEYEVTVRTGTTDMMDTTVTGTSVNIGGLTAGTIYTFAVVAVDTDVLSGDDRSTETTVNWSPAWRFNSDSQIGGTTVLRLYPRSVPPGAGKGSGIVIGPSGAYNASVAGSGADIGLIQLIADVDAGGAQFTIGSPKAPEFNSFTNFANFRSDVQVSDASVEIDPAEGLNGWYRSSSLEGLFSAAGSTKAFTFGDKLTNNNGVGFAVRWGAAGAYRYARVYVVPSSSGQLIQTDGGGDRYVEVRISYQDTPGVPYAKGS